MIKYEARAVESIPPLRLGEGPCWDAGIQALYFVDILGKSLHRYFPATGAHEIFGMGKLIGTVAPTRGERVLVALEDGAYLFHPATQEMELLCAIERDMPNNRFNDGKCDPSGRFYAGTMLHRETGDASGSLYCVEADGSVQRVLEGVTISNGIGYSPDQRTMYYIDTPTMHVDAFDHDIKTGALSNRRAVVNITPGEGGPDGMTVDVEGMLWVAQWGGYRVCRYDPATGEKLAQVDVPAERTSACAFGGPNMDQLYITTAMGGDGSGPEDGRLFVVTLPVRALAAFRFAGQ